MLKSSKRAKARKREDADTAMMRKLIEELRQAIDGVEIERVTAFGSIKRGGVDKLRAIWSKYQKRVRGNKPDVQVLDDGRHWSVVLVPKK